MCMHCGAAHEHPELQPHLMDLLDHGHRSCTHQQLCGTAAQGSRFVPRQEEQVHKGQQFSAKQEAGEGTVFQRKEVFTAAGLGQL